MDIAEWMDLIIKAEDLSRSLPPIPETTEEYGTAASGNRGHKGRPGVRGGSGSGTSVPEPPKGSVYKGEVWVQTKNGLSEAPGLNERYQKEVQDLMVNHPQAVVDKVRYVMVCMDKESWEKECEAVRGTPPDQIGAFYKPDYSMIVIPSKRLNFSYFDHEVGHAAWKYSMTRSKWTREYDRNPHFDRSTAYSVRGGAQEAFAENYMSWISRRLSGVAGNWKSFPLVEEVVNGVK